MKKYDINAIDIEYIEIPVADQLAMRKSNSSYFIDSLVKFSQNQEFTGIK